MKEKFKKNEMSERIIVLLESSCKDFRGVKTAYAEACAELRSKFKYTDRIIEYNNCIAAYETELAFEQGIKDNFNYFNNPNKILSDDYYSTLESTIRLRTEDIVTERKRIVKLLPASLISAYDAVIEYTVFLDTYIPKLAHYYGFVYGNKNNYNPDSEACKKYKDWLSTYLGIEPEGEKNALL